MDSEPLVAPETDTPDSVDSETVMPPESDTPDQPDTAVSTCAVADASGVRNDLSSGETIRLSDENIYDFRSSLLFSHGVVRGNSDLTIDWSSLTSDLRGRPTDPAADVDVVMISLWSQGMDVLVQQIADDTLDMSKSLGDV